MSGGSNDCLQAVLCGAGYSTRPGRLNFDAMPDMPAHPKHCDGVNTPSRFDGIPIANSAQGKISFLVGVEPQDEWQIRNALLRKSRLTEYQHVSRLPV